MPHPQAAPSANAPSRRKLPLAAAAVYAALLTGLALAGAVPLRPAPLALADLADAKRLQGYVLSAAAAACGNVLLFAALGGIAAALPRRPAGLGGLGRGLFVGASVSILAAAAVLAMAAGGWPELVVAAAPAAGCALGAWTVSFWRCGGRLRWSLAGQAAALPLGLFLLAQNALESRPWTLPAAQISSAEKRRLVELVRQQRLKADPEAEVRSLRLSERDANLLASWGLQVVYGDDSPAAAHVQFFQDGFIAHAALPLPRSPGRYLNIAAAAAASIDEGRLSLRLRSLRVGRVKLPAVLAPLASASLESLVRSEPELRRVVARTEAASIAAGGVTLAVERGAFGEEVLAVLEPAQREVREATIAQLRHLDGLFGPVHPAARSFEAYVQSSFALAARRSLQGQSAAAENRAALYALGILLGHPRLGKLIFGADFDEAAHAAAAAHVGRVPLAGRRDWTRHFAVSAALAAFANPAVSDAAGLLKEELDAGEGGSGFSFGDLLADRAGTRFALAATRDEAAARGLQASLLQPWTVEDLFPAAADLPEGLSQGNLDEQFGGVGGAAYRRMTAEIEARLDRCRLLH